MLTWHLKKQIISLIELQYDWTTEVHVKALEIDFKNKKNIQFYLICNIPIVRCDKLNIWILRYPGVGVWFFISLTLTVTGLALLCCSHGSTIKYAEAGNTVQKRTKFKKLAEHWFWHLKTHLTRLPSHHICRLELTKSVVTEQAWDLMETHIIKCDFWRKIRMIDVGYSSVLKMKIWVNYRRRCEYICPRSNWA